MDDLLFTILIDQSSDLLCLASLRRHWILIPLGYNHRNRPRLATNRLVKYSLELIVEVSVQETVHDRVDAARRHGYDVTRQEQKAV